MRQLAYQNLHVYTYIVTRWQAVLSSYKNTHMLASIPCPLLIAWHARRADWEKYNSVNNRGELLGDQFA